MIRVCIRPMLIVVGLLIGLSVLPLQAAPLVHQPPLAAPTLNDAQTSNRLTDMPQLVGLTSRLFDGFQIHGNYLYTRSVNKFLIFDITDRSSPHLVGYIRNLPNISYSVRGDYVYILNHKTKNLDVYDIFNKSMPIKINTVKLPFGMRGNYLAGDYIYMSEFECSYNPCTSKNNIFVANIANPYDILTNVVTLPISGWIAFNDERYLYFLQNDTQHINLIDLQDPMNPQPVGVVSIDYGNFNTVYAKEHFLYATAWNRPNADNKELITFDITNPENPIQLGAFDCLDRIQGYDGDKLYIRGYTSIPDIIQVQEWDISTPQTPTLTGTHDTDFHDFMFNDGIAIINNYAKGIRIQEELFDDSSMLGQIINTSYRPLKDQYVYRMPENVTNAIEIFDVSNRSFPIRTDTITTTLPVQDMIIEGNIAYLLTKSYQPELKSEIVIYDITDPYHLIQKSSIKSPVYDNVEIQNNYIYISKADNIHIFDVHNSQDPVLISTYSIESSSNIMVKAHGAKLFAHYLDTQINQYQLILLDITNPYAPSQLATYTYPYTTFTNLNIYIYGEYLYLVDPQARIIVFNITNQQVFTPIDQIEISSPPGFSGIGSVVVEGQKMYVSIAKGTLDEVRVFNIADPTSIELIGTMLLSDNNHYVPSGAKMELINGDIYVYLSDGIEIYDPTPNYMGSVKNTYQHSIPGVTIHINDAPMLMTNLQGSYSLEGLADGVYTVKPSSQKAVFWPPTRTIQIDATHRPESLINQDFYMLARPVSTTVDVAVTQVLTFTNLHDNPTVLTIPANAVSTTTTITLSERMEFDRPGWVFANHAFDLTAEQYGNPTSLTFTTPVTVTFHYSPRDAATIIDESVSLWYWVDSLWQPAAEVCGTTPAHDPTTNTLVVPLCQTGRIALFGPTNQLFMPKLTQ